MLDELARVIQERTGLDEAMSQQVAQVAIEFMKSKVPPQFSGLLDGQNVDLGAASNLLAHDRTSDTGLHQWVGAVRCPHLSG